MLLCHLAIAALTWGSGSPLHPEAGGYDANWAKISQVDYLADRTDEPGVVAIRQSGKALLLNASGEVEREIPFDPGERVLRYNGRGLVTSDTIRSHPPSSMLMRWDTIGQGASYLLVHNWWTAITDRFSISLPVSGTDGGMAIRSDGQAVSVLEQPMHIPLLTEYGLLETQEDQASQLRQVINPQIERLGFASIVRRFNDLRYAGTDDIVYLGRVTQIVEVPYKTFLDRARPVFDAPEFKLEEGAKRDGFLFTVNLRTRITTALIRTTYRDNLEQGPPAFGAISVSSDSKSVYVRGIDTIARVSFEEWWKRG